MVKLQQCKGKMFRHVGLDTAGWELVLQNIKPSKKIGKFQMWR